MFKDIRLDMSAVGDNNKFKVFLTNRGFHALLFYRISNKLWKMKIPLLPLILTRIIQIIYAIDIDYRADIKGGCVIFHGVGLVIGQGSKIGKNVRLYHGVTLGISHSISKPDGFPSLGDNVIVGAGAKLLGKIKIGANVKIGANSVVTSNIPDNSTALGIPAIYECNIKKAQ